MHPYQNQHGNSGVIGYEIGENAIRVWFRDRDDYLYTYKSAGRKNIEMMKALAISGHGLATYINQHVAEKYEK